jgi:hypothetical protein
MAIAGAILGLLTGRTYDHDSLSLAPGKKDDE